MEKTEALFQNEPKVAPKLNTLPQNPDSPDPQKAVGLGRFPKWLHRKLPRGNNLLQTEATIRKHRLHTVCEEAKCPNLLECYSKKTATFLVLGKECTRHCGFCEIDFAKTPAAPSSNEPEEIAQSVMELGLRHVVITMVARDDLSDGGSSHLIKIIQEIRKQCPEVTIETLTSDFDGNLAALEQLLAEKPEIFNHNIETVERLTPRVRNKATYRRTLTLLAHAKKHSKNLLVKSGLMVGLGEEKGEVFETLSDLADTGCTIVTIGQYLQPSHKKLFVKEFIHPDLFKEYETEGARLGINYVYAGPFIRSSYNAHIVFKKANKEIIIESE